ncbi:aspartic peptidase domain-containing protein [Lipomyces orientalis]|uniref:Aspartic peptidase domain-containing protein n=1 Tax=Lipomyces orientalis TaxID=1233043 RepID=A0ACC3TY86_9ASCO
MWTFSYTLLALLIWQDNVALCSSIVTLSLHAKEYRRPVVSYSCESCEPLRSSVKNTLEIDQNGSDVSYYVDIQLGSDENSVFSVVVDTGSYDLWVYSQSCTNISCVSHNQFGPQDSASIEVYDDKSFSISYGQGKVSGIAATDYVQLAGYNVSMGFGLAEDVADSFNAFPVDGILGLSASDLQINGYPSIIAVLARDGLISREVFGIDLGTENDPEGGSMSIGGVDTSRFTGDISFVDVANDQGLWIVGVDDCYVNGEAEGFSDKLALIDTGTTLILIPSDDALQIHKDLVGSNGVVRTDGTNYAIACNTTTELAFGFGGVRWAVNPSDYIGNPLDDNGNCLTNIQGVSVNGSSTWLMGASFLKGIYTIYDKQNMRVGFAARGTGGNDIYNDGNPTSSVSVEMTSTFQSLSPSTNSFAAISMSTISAESTTSNISVTSSSSLSKSSDDLQTISPTVIRSKLLSNTSALISTPTARSTFTVASTSSAFSFINSSLQTAFPTFSTSSRTTSIASSESASASSTTTSSTSTLSASCTYKLAILVSLGTALVPLLFTFVR